MVFLRIIGVLVAFLKKKNMLDMLTAPPGERLAYGRSSTETNVSKSMPDQLALRSKSEEVQKFFGV